MWNKSPLQRYVHLRSEANVLGRQTQAVLHNLYAHRWLNRTALEDRKLFFRTM